MNVITTTAVRRLLDRVFDTILRRYAPCGVIPFIFIVEQAKVFDTGRRFACRPDCHLDMERSTLVATLAITQTSQKSTPSSSLFHMRDDGPSFARIVVKKRKTNIRNLDHAGATSALLIGTIREEKHQYRRIGTICTKSGTLLVQLAQNTVLLAVSSCTVSFVRATCRRFQPQK